MTPLFPTSSFSCELMDESSTGKREYDLIPAQKRILLQLYECQANRLVEWTDGIFIEPLGIAATRMDVHALVRQGLVYPPGSIPIARGGPGPLEDIEQEVDDQ